MLYGSTEYLKAIWEVKTKIKQTEIINGNIYMYIYINIYEKHPCEVCYCRHISTI